MKRAHENPNQNFKTILIPVDGSPQADETVRNLQAFSLPKRICLLHCFSVPQLAYPGTGMSVGQEFLKVAEQEMRKEGSRILQRAT